MDEHGIDEVGSNLGSKGQSGKDVRNEGLPQAGEKSQQADKSQLPASDKARTIIDSRSGLWLKGNLHAHTTISDGKLSPPEVAKMYRDNGYSFLAISDHQVHTYFEDLQAPGFVILPAVEVNVSFGSPRRFFHANGILGPKSYQDAATRERLEHMQFIPMPAWESYSTGQAIVDDLEASGNMVMFNHPYWSLNCIDDLLKIDGYFAVEIFNYASEVETGNGVSTIHWDAVLRSGRRVWGIATDDNHNGNKYGEAPADWDSFGGWITVGTQELSHQAITSSILNGNFYSSSGPEIYHLSLDGDEVHVECSPVRRIYFITYPRHGYSRCTAGGGLIESASYRLRGTEKYVRVECVDASGRRAWSNPIWPEFPEV